MKNVLGIEVTRPDDVLIIMRGIPGSGKSTLASTLVDGGVIHSTDTVIESKGDYTKFFVDMINEKDFSPLHKAHSENNRNVKTAMVVGVSPIIVDNTNIKANEPKELVEHALKLGYADENIRFVEVGTGGLTAEELAERNTHGVPLDKINSMIESMNSVGNLTLKKVIDSKPMFKSKPKVLFSAVVLDEASKIRLTTALGHKIPADWDIHAHHMTIIFGKGLPEEIKEDKDKMVHLIATEIGISDMAIAVKVSGYLSTNEIPHVTIGVNTKDGGTPRMSNDITNWEVLNSHINLSGIVTEIKPN